MRKEPNKGFRGRLNKAIGYTVFGIVIGFIIGFLTSSVITHRQAVIRDSNRIALSGEYTAVLVQRERMLDDGSIEVLDSKVMEVYR